MAAFHPRHVLVTGGAGFIGSAYVRTALAADSERQVTVLDQLTYAGNLANLEGLVDRTRLRFVAGDIADRGLVASILAEGVDAVLNFAAETHVDRSIRDAGRFVQTDVLGTYALLEEARRAGVARFLQVSTDEVYGDVPTGASSEEDRLAPRSPYAASKAGGELLVQAYQATHGLPTLVTRGANTFGPRQYPEKLVPLAITSALCGLPIPLYGDGLQVRDWLYVEDHCAAIETVLTDGTPGQAYNVGAGNHLTNRGLVGRLLALCGRGPDLIYPAADRPGHDQRYAMDTARLAALGWQPRHHLEEALAKTVAWYRDREDWWRPLREGEDFVVHYRRTYRREPVSPALAGGAR